MQDGESHLYDEQGRFRFLGKKVGICLLCRSKDLTYSVGAMGPNSRFCKDCILKNGPRNLRRDANMALQKATRKVDQIREGWEAMQKRYMERFGTTLKLYKNGAPE